MTDAWIPIKHAPWDGRKYLLTDGARYWITSRQHGEKHRDGAPISGHDFGRPQGAGHPTHYAHLPPLPQEPTR
jgi:hypothetical protein